MNGGTILHTYHSTTKMTLFYAMYEKLSPLVIQYLLVLSKVHEVENTLANSRHAFKDSLGLSHNYMK